MKPIQSIKDIQSKEELYVGGPGTCGGCPAPIALKLALKALGKETVVVNAAGCMTLLVVYPNTPLKVSWLHSAIENSGSTASSIRRALDIKYGKNKGNVLVFSGDGATYDIGFQSLSHAVTKKENFIYLCYNNQSFGNTGFQWNSATPYGSKTKTTPREENNMHGNIRKQKDIEKILAAHGDCYIATASMSDPVDFYNKIIKAAKYKGPAFINYLTPCVPGWVIDEGETINYSKLAVETNFWPLFEVSPDGILTLNKKTTKTKPIKDFLKGQGRYKGIPAKDLKILQKRIDDRYKELLEKDGKKFV